MNYRTDLTIELAEGADEQSGVKSEVNVQNGVTITRTVISDSAAEQLVGKPQGKYFTLEMLPFSDAAFEPDECFEAAADILRELLPEHGCVLAAGLGNASITPDSIGPKAAGRILATRHISGELAEKCGLAPLRMTVVIAPGVLGQTGVEAAEHIKWLCVDNIVKRGGCELGDEFGADVVENQQVAAFQEIEGVLLVLASAEMLALDGVEEILCRAVDHAVAFADDPCRYCQ